MDIFTIEEETCFNLSLLFLMTEQKRFCISASITNDTAIAMTQISVRLYDNDDDTNNLQYFPYCGSIGSLVADRSIEFSCNTLNFNELKDVKFVIRGYNPSVDDEWNSKVKLTVEHDCTDLEGEIYN